MKAHGVEIGEIGADVVNRRVRRALVSVRAPNHTHA